MLSEKDLIETAKRMATLLHVLARSAKEFLDETEKNANALEAAARAELEPKPNPAKLTCIWTPDETDGLWDTDCGGAWIFPEGGPKDNKCKFCPYCGRKILTRRKLSNTNPQQT